MKLLFIDTETSGFPIPKLPANHLNQAWIVQAGFIFMDDDKITSQGCFLIESDGRKISKGAQKIHGISTTDTDKFGISEHSLNTLLRLYISRCDKIIGHNIAFDLRMIRLLLKRSEDSGFLKGYRRNTLGGCLILGHQK